MVYIFGLKIEISFIFSNETTIRLEKNKFLPSINFIHFFSFKRNV